MEIWQILKIVCGGFFMLISSNIYGFSRVNLWSLGKKKKLPEAAGCCWVKSVAKKMPNQRPPCDSSCH